MWTVFLACAGTEHLFSITTQSQTQHSRTLCTFFERIAPIASFSGGFCAVRRHLSSLDARGLFERDETRTRPRAHGPRRARGPRDAKQPNEHNAKRDWFIYGFTYGYTTPLLENEQLSIGLGRLARPRRSLKEASAIF